MSYFSLRFIFRFLLLFVISFSIIFLYFIYTSNSNSTSIADNVKHDIDNVLGYAEEANVMSLEGNNLLSIEKCSEETLYDLRKIVLDIPYVRTTNLAANKVIHCTSFFGKSDFEDNENIYVKEKLALLTGNAINLDHPLIAFRTEKRDIVALSGVDAIYIKNILDKNVLDDHFRVYFNIGGMWLNERGKVEKVSPRKKLSLVNSVSSSKFPFSVYVGYAYPSLFSAFVFSNMKFLILTFIFIVAMSIFITFVGNRKNNFKLILIDAIKRKDIKPYAQGIYSLKQKRFVGFEVLARWVEKNGNIIYPNQFIPQVDENDLLEKMTVSLIEDTLDSIGSVYDFDLSTDFYISFNICPSRVSSSSLLKVFRKYKINDNPRLKIILELTEEHAIGKDLIVGLDDVCREFHNVCLAIDDFGTGYANLTHLSELIKLNVRYLKVDRCFIQNVAECRISQQIVSNIVDLSKSFSLIIVAEGVENKEQVKVLENLDIDFLQGYFYSKPKNLGEFIGEL